MKKLPKSTSRSAAVISRAQDIKQAEPASWTFLTNHTHVLLCLFRHPDRRLRDVAVAVGITERMVQKIVSELSQAGYLKISKEGRRNSYEVHANLRLRHALEKQHTIGTLLTVLKAE